MSIRISPSFEYNPLSWHQNLDQVSGRMVSAGPQHRYAAITRSRNLGPYASVMARSDYQLTFYANSALFGIRHI